MKATELDKKFDSGEEDILEEFNLSTVKKVNHQQKRVNIDFPIGSLKLLIKKLTELV
jgi:hypothetical protein